MAIKISTKQLLAQVKDDLWGKDSQRGYSFTYSWMANQLGHIALGFIVSCALAWGAKAIWPSLPSYYPCLGVALFWTIFEFFNCLGSIRKTSKNGAFPTPTAMVISDTATDVFFFYNGITWAILGFTGCGWLAIVAAVFFVCMLLLGGYWLRRKMFAWWAEFAVQFRLAQFVGKISESNIEIVNDFLKNPIQKHLLITGNSGSGKTLLATGIGTELAYKKEAVSYRTLFKWLPELVSGTPNNSSDLWTWQQATAVVIDDIAPTINNSPLIDLSATLQLMETYFPSQAVANPLQAGFIWVIGDAQVLAIWEKLLKDKAVCAENIKIITVGV